MAIALKSNTSKAPTNRVELFSIDDVSYSVSTKVNANVPLQYMWILKHEGQENAQAYALETVLGPEAYNALMNFDDLEEEDMEQILNALHKIMLGDSEEDFTK